MRDKSGINKYEDPDEPMPKGYVQVMTIHQAKGLQFPVVVVGSLAVRLSSPKDVDRVLGPFYHRSPFEPANRITGFERMRLHYVAFIGKVDLDWCAARRALPKHNVSFLIDLMNH